MYNIIYFKILIFIGRCTIQIRGLETEKKTTYDQHGNDYNRFILTSNRHNR